MNNITVNISDEFDNCDNIVLAKYDIFISTICTTLALFGLVYTYFGYRCFKAVMFLSGLIFGATTVYLLCREERIFEKIVSFEIAIGISVGIGVLCGLITMLVRYIGVFLQGFFLGVLLAFAGIIGLQSFYHPSTPWIPGGILFGTGILCSLLTLKFQKRLLIVSTAVFGSILITLCVDYFLEEFRLMLYAWDALMTAPSATVCWYTWVILAIWPTLSVTGVLVQWKVTAKGYDHTDVVIPRGRRKHVRTHLVRQQRPRQSSNAGRTRASANVARSIPARSTQSSRRPSDRRSLVQVPPETLQPIVNVPDNDSGLPPSYYECMHLDAGDPVAGSSHPFSLSGAVDSTNRASASTSGHLQNDLLHQMASGQGYAASNAQPSPSRGYVANARTRSTDQRQSIPEPNHEPIEGYSRAERSKPYRRQNKGSGSRRVRISPASGGSRAGRDARQRLLSDQPRSRDAITAHAQRLLAVRNSQTGQVQSTSSSSAVNSHI